MILFPREEELRCLAKTSRVNFSSPSEWSTRELTWIHHGSMMETVVVLLLVLKPDFKRCPSVLHIILIPLLNHEMERGGGDGEQWRDEISFYSIIVIHRNLLTNTAQLEFAWHYTSWTSVLDLESEVVGLVGHRRVKMQHPLVTHLNTCTFSRSAHGEERVWANNQEINSVKYESKNKALPSPRHTQMEKHTHKHTHTCEHTPETLHLLHFQQ